MAPARPAAWGHAWAPPAADAAARAARWGAAARRAAAAAGAYVSPLPCRRSPAVRAWRCARPHNPKGSEMLGACARGGAAPRAGRQGGCLSCTCGVRV